MASNAMTVAYNQISDIYGKTLFGTSNRYDAHKKSDLRDTYNRIVKSNKESPLYRLKDNDNVASFAINVKEQAEAMKNVVASLSEDGEGMEAVYGKKIAASDDPDVVTAEYIGDASDENTTGFSLEVKQLATPQINEGNYLRRDGRDFRPGSYSFDLNTNHGSYEFQYNVNDDDSDEEVQAKVRKLINNAGIGLTAELVSNADNTRKALHIESKQTGLSGSEEFLFQIVPASDRGSSDAMNVLGIDRVSSEAENSRFVLNGNEHSSYANTFTVNNRFSVTLNGVSQEGHAAFIGFKPSADAVADNVENLISAYNSIINTASSFADRQETSAKLLSDVSAIAGRFKDQFAEIGLNVEDDASITMDREALISSIEENGGDSSRAFGTLNSFRDALGRHANKASIDPMSYVDKVVVEYKIPGKSFSAPYATSPYAGMMVDRIC